MIVPTPQEKREVLTKSGKNVVVTKPACEGDAGARKSDGKTDGNPPRQTALQDDQLGHQK
jgi:hypothetical protein